MGRYAPPHNVIGSDLPNNEIGHIRQDIFIKTGNIIRQVIHGPTAIDHLDLGFGLQSHQLLLHYVGECGPFSKRPKPGCGR